MKKLVVPLVLIFFFVISTVLHSQTTYNVTVTNFSFSPQTVNINVGDIVKWTNTGGNHNVVADDNSFTSGPPSISAWTYEHTFTQAGTYPYYCVIHGSPGGIGMSGVVIVQSSTGVNDKNDSPYKFELQQNFPNPFNPSTEISYSIPVKSQVVLKVYDVLGNELATLVNEEKPAGTYKMTYNGSNLESGVYFYRLQAGNITSTRKMIFMK